MGRLKDQERTATEETVIHTVPKGQAGHAREGHPVQHRGLQEVEGTEKSVGKRLDCGSSGSSGQGKED